MSQRDDTKWVKGKPEREGWYWWWFGWCGSRVAHVHYRGDDMRNPLCVRFEDDKIAPHLSVISCDGYWQPMTPPEPPEER